MQTVRGSAKKRTSLAHRASGMVQKVGQFSIQGSSTSSLLQQAGHCGNQDCSVRGKPQHKVHRMGQDTPHKLRSTFLALPLLWPACVAPLVNPLD